MLVIGWPGEEFGLELVIHVAVGVHSVDSANRMVVCADFLLCQTEVCGLFQQIA